VRKPAPVELAGLSRPNGPLPNGVREAADVVIGSHFLLNFLLTSLRLIVQHVAQSRLDKRLLIPF
jgi:hypothetical protein